MNRGFLYSLTLAAVSHLATPAPARGPAPQPIYERAARADVILVGKVESLEEKTVVLPDKSEYQIVVVKVSDPLFNAKDLTHVRVGFRTGKRRPEREVCLFLSQKFGQDFYVAPLSFDAVEKSAETFVRDVAEAKRCAKLLADPETALRSKDADERLLTASMLLTRYRTVKEGQIKQEPIDAVQSRLILQALADADWDKQYPAGQPSPVTTFVKLGLPTQRDGWIPPREFKDFPSAAQEWLKRNVATYRILKYAADKMK